MRYKAAGRKTRIRQIRMQHAARVLSKFDPSGRCQDIRPAANTILRELMAAELRYDERDRLKWSRRTMFRAFGWLEEAGILTSRGLTAEHGTRRRALHQESLLPVGGECGTPGRPECGTQEVKVFQSHKPEPEKPDPSQLAKPASRDAALATSELIPIQDEAKQCRNGNDAFLRSARVLMWTHGAFEGAALTMWIAYRALRAGTVPKSIRYYANAAENFGHQYENTGVLQEAEGRLLAACPRSRGLVDAVYASKEYQQELKGLEAIPTGANTERLTYREQQCEWATEILNEKGVEETGFRRGEVQGCREILTGDGDPPQVACPKRKKPAPSPAQIAANAQLAAFRWLGSRQVFGLAPFRRVVVKVFEEREPQDFVVTVLRRIGRRARVAGLKPPCGLRELLYMWRSSIACMTSSAQRDSEIESGEAFYVVRGHWVRG
jgi:hypothetical protein